MEYGKLPDLAGHTDCIMCLAFSHEFRYLLSGSCDGSIRVWDLIAQTELAVLEGHENWVTSVCFSYNDAFILSGSYDSTVRLWNFKDKV
jgi:WD40 repeat protein